MTRARDTANLIGSGNFSSTTFTATAGQTAFTISHTQGFVQVFMNGLLLDETADYTSNGTAITLTSGAAAGDEIEVVKYNTFSVGDAQTQAQADTRYLQTSGGTMTGNLTVSGGTVSATGTSALTNPEADLGVYHSFKNLSSDVNTGIGIALGSNNNSGATIYAQRTGSNNEHKMGFQTRNSSGAALTRMAVDGSGHVTMPYQPGWHGTHADNYNSTYASGQAHNMDASLEQYNVGNHFDYSNDRFTCPVSGYYLVYGWDICLNSSPIYDAGNAIGCWKNSYSGGNRLVSVYRQYNRGYQFTATAYLAANDYVTFGNTEGSIGAGAYYGSLSYSGYGIRLLA